MKKQKNVQIPAELFGLLREYFLMDDHRHHKEIMAMVEKKSESLLDHQIYSLSKTQSEEADREAARNWYLDRKGYHEDFRY